MLCRRKAGTVGRLEPDHNDQIQKSEPYSVDLKLPLWSKSCVYVYACPLSSIQLFATPWTVAFQAPLSMGFSRQEYWSGLPFPSPEDLPNPEIKPVSLASPALAGRSFTH